MTLFCKGCGAKLERPDRFCSDCGQTAGVDAASSADSGLHFLNDDGRRKIRIVCAAALIPGVFMPWVNIWGMGIAGYKIPEFAGGLRQFGIAAGQDPTILILYLPYVIPVLALVTIVNALASEPTGQPDVLGLITGAGPFLGFLYVLSQVGANLFQILDIGSYWTLAAAGVLAGVSLQSDTQAWLGSKPTYECSSCHTHLGVDDKSCPTCGATGSQRTISSSSDIVGFGGALAPVTSSFCAECGERAQKEDKFCSQCGSAVS